jgi:hypothetical protein
MTGGGIDTVVLVKEGAIAVAEAMPGTADAAGEGTTSDGSACARITPLGTGKDGAKALIA